VKRDLDALTSREHDLVVVGGGIYGVAAAWDAAQRGLRTALVEAGDFGSGTSRNSLKTIHGGLRHLRRLELRSMRESIRERSALLRIAPEVVRPLPFLVPTYGHGLKGWEGLAAGVTISDLIGRDRNRGLIPARQLPAGRMLSRVEVCDLVAGFPNAASPEAPSGTTPRSRAANASSSVSCTRRRMPAPCWPTTWKSRVCCVRGRAWSASGRRIG
jgi:glycerol-3-phosphate dehydrogenase